MSEDRATYLWAIVTAIPLVAGGLAGIWLYVGPMAAWGAGLAIFLVAVLLSRKVKANSSPPGGR